MCERVLTDVDPSRRSHDAVHKKLTLMTRKLLCYFLYCFCSFVCFSDTCAVGRKKEAEKRAAAAEKELALLRGTLESKEKDLQVQLDEVNRLRRAEEKFQRVEMIERDRLRTLTSGLTGKRFVPVLLLWW